MKHISSKLLTAVLPLITILASISVSEEAHAELDAKQIMNSVVQPKDIRTICFVKGMKVTSYTHVTSDGLSYSRMEIEPITNKYGIKTVTVKNREGTWDLRPDMAIRMDYLNVPNASQVQKPQFNVQASYTVQEKVLAGKSCYVVTQVYSEQTRADLLDMVAQSINDKQKAKRMPHVMAATILYDIGKDDRLIYGIHVYNSEGTLLTDVFYSSISTNALQDALFEVPSSVKLVITHTQSEYRSILPYLPADLVAKDKRNPQYSQGSHLHSMWMILLAFVVIAPLAFVLRYHFTAKHAKEL